MVRTSYFFETATKFYDENIARRMNWMWHMVVSGFHLYLFSCDDIICIDFVLDIMWSSMSFHGCVKFPYWFCHGHHLILDVVREFSYLFSLLWWLCMDFCHGHHLILYVVPFFLSDCPVPLNWFIASFSLVSIMFYLQMLSFLKTSWFMRYMNV